MRKITSIIISACLMFCCFCTNVSATDEDTNTNEDIILMNLYTDTVSTTLSKSSSNIVYSCNVVGKSTATKISIYLYLQEYKNGNWSNVDVVTKTATTRSAHVSDKFSSAVSGRIYRTEAHVYVYSGSKYEYLEANSATMIY